MSGRKPMTEIGDDKREKWHVSLGIPVVFIITTVGCLLINVGAFVWYASQFNSRVGSVELAQSTSTQIIEKVQATAISQGTQLVRLDERVISLQATASRIESLLTPVKTR